MLITNNSAFLSNSFKSTGQRAGIRRDPTGSHYYKGNGTPRKLATVISENCYQQCSFLNFAAPFSNMCSTQAVNNSRKLQLCCGCQFPWCALALNVQLKVERNKEGMNGRNRERERTKGENKIHKEREIKIKRKKGKENTKDKYIIRVRWTD
jgi:hypothetical protein